MKDHRPQTSDAELQRTHECYVAHNNSIRATSQTMGLTRPAIRDRLNRWEVKLKNKALEIPEFPESELPIKQVIAGMEERSALRRASYAARTWFPVNIKDDKPIAIAWFGDPHVDDDGCDWTLLNRHIALCGKPGVYGANIGDTTNNWAGRLIRKYADQETSASTARRLAKWFMLESGVVWLVWILGNHDEWGDGAAILSEMAKQHGTQKLGMHDWEARFSLNFPNGETINVWAAHDFPGESMWNPLHGPVKAARFGPDVDLLVCGHKHSWGISNWELADKGTTPTMIRCRGYKFDDDYARRIGKVEQSEGAAILTIINPKAETRSGRLLAFADMDAGVDYLQWLRKKS